MVRLGQVGNVRFGQLDLHQLSPLARIMMLGGLKVERMVTLVLLKRRRIKRGRTCCPCCRESRWADIGQPVLHGEEEPGPGVCSQLSPQLG